MEAKEKTMLNELIAIMEQYKNKSDAASYEVYKDILHAYNVALQNEKWTGNENIGKTVADEYEWQIAHIN
jgi:hypothetical protein